ncbi:MAG: fasciclin domain-containing protein [Chitinophagaceae bacterium]|nr:MAG: fasciclin domain-containing protein [Chitinophagaceae bacterium]
MKRSTRFYSLSILFTALCFMSCKKQSSVDMPPSIVNAYDAFSEDSYNFSSFKYLIDRAGQADLLRSGTYTIFAPNNQAFIAAGYTTAAIQAMSKDSVVRLLRNHLVDGKMESSGLMTGQQLTTLNGDKLLVQKVGNDLYVDGANITNTNETVSNGVFHVINKVLAKRSSLLERLSTYANSTSNSQFTFLMAAIARASQGSTDFNALFSDPAANYTFFSPNNGAFIDGGYTSVAAVTAAVPDTLGRLLKRHMISSRLLTTDFDTSKPQTTLGGTLVYFDRLKPGTTTYNYANGLIVYGGSSNMLGGNNGVIHSVSRFLPIPQTVTTLARIQSDTTLSYFNAALVKASSGGIDFVKMLSDPAASYTVFAVNNAGFRSAGYATAAAVSNESAATLAKMLQLHLLNKRINNINIAENGTVQTLLTTDTGTPVSLTFTLTGGFKIKGASNVNTIPVITQNIVTTNGQLNIIGSLLTP